MADGRIVSLADYRADGAPQRSTGLIDLWELVTTGATADGALRFGVTSLAEIVQLCGAPDDITLDALGDLGEGIRLWEHEEFAWHFGPDQRFAGLSFGAPGTDQILRLVESAVSLHDHSGTPILRPPGVDILLDDRIFVRLRGRQLNDFATLPAALGVMHEIAPQTITSRTSDKWISLKYAAPYGELTAGFLLKAFKLPHVAEFNIDYCLHAIGVSWSGVAVTTASPRAPSA
ncbi:MAG: hypothetical protein ACKVP7_23210 [Hyphomicrobiaceae bacterium]